MDKNQPPKNYPKSPLGYAGGKSRAVKIIYPFIPLTETKLCSPFLGGASIELACTTKAQVYGYDIFNPLVDFWQCLLSTQNLLVKRVESYYPLTKAQFYKLQRDYVTEDDKIERAAIYYVLNRSSFSGTTLSGDMLRTFQVKNFTVNCEDFRQSIPKHDDAFLYLDPPYMIKQMLYGTRGSTHKGFDHIALANIVHERDRWIMSYNDCADIRRLYSDKTIITVKWIYGMAKNKESKEILILSDDLIK